MTPSRGSRDGRRWGRWGASARGLVRGVHRLFSAFVFFLVPFDHFVRETISDVSMKHSVNSIVPSFGSRCHFSTNSIRGVHNIKANVSRHRSIRFARSNQCSSFASHFLPSQRNRHHFFTFRVF